MKLSIIIPIFNRWKFTKECLESLKKQSYSDFNIIIVDDGSTDESEAMLNEFYPEITVLKGDGNYWWTKSVNTGIRDAIDKNYDYILLLNNDTVLHKDFIKNILDCSSKYPKSIIGAHAINLNSQKTEYCGEKMNWLTAKSRLNIFDKTKNVLESDFLPGRGLLVSKEVLSEVGLFDEKTFPHYIADYDLTYRAKIKGYKLLSCLNAIVYTYPGESHASRIKNNKSLKNFYLHLFSIKGAGNIIRYSVFAFRNCPTLYLPIFLPFTLIRRIFGYFK